MSTYLNDAKSLLIGILSSSGVVFLTSNNINNQDINNNIIMIMSAIILLGVTHVEHKRKLKFEKQIIDAIQDKNQIIDEKEK